MAKSYAVSLHIPANLEASSFLAAIIESSEDAIIGEDLSWIVASWNKAAEHLSGYAASEIVGKSITTIFPPERQGEEKTLLERIKRGERIKRFETQNEKRWVTD